MTKPRTLSVDTFIDRYSKLVPGTPSPLWNDQRTHIPAALADGDWQWIATLYDRLENNTPPSLHIVRSDALFALGLGRDPRSLDAFVTRVRRVPSWRNGFDRTGRGWPRKLGALLGYGQSIASLEYLTETYGDSEDVREMLLCATQELVSLGEPVRDSAILARFWRRETERAEGHPLAGLPLSLLDIENGLRKRWPSPEPDLLGNWFWLTESFTTHGAESAEPLERAVIAREIPCDSSFETRVAGALCDPMSFPNGSREARAFDIERQRGPVSVRDLPLECLKDNAEPIQELPRTARQTLGALWSLFTSGGAYAEGRSAAYGRAQAWSSLAALCGADISDDLAAIEERAERSWFTAFTSASSWFNHVCIDVGITCTREDGRSLAVFAATDSD